MFPKNTWYVAATSNEIDEKPLGRTICNERIVFYRGEENKVATRGHVTWLRICPAGGREGR